tara:strand:+ start:254 stop:664 length:411 start_codon:yes stop_codon:yes gene_type:complete
MKKNEIVLNISQGLYLTKKIKNKNYLYINNRIEYKKLKKNNTKKNIIYFAIVDFKKFKLSELINIFLLINKHFNVYKNFLIFFDLKKEIIAHNLFPDWPGKYKFSNTFENFFFWFKQIFSNLILFKKISFIVIKFK